VGIHLEHRERSAIDEPTQYRDWHRVVATEHNRHRARAQHGAHGRLRACRVSGPIVRRALDVAGVEDPEADAGRDHRPVQIEVVVLGEAGQAL
jgi:hypothetical protein